ncbi:crotonase/enoyl-CoA hydratase family protein [Mangrovivirga sp. M17]|uniref:Crotonase/enoyl-CoA hydratase family protein n=1 Tax=Mangrovivirga halotolerans TaxID=2993936 RepID=A0ABT3RW08_9BACT|nr:crotonase/enoyl-CoA hydratase family protein [Mangrovivirga halotolerans]MCX2745528.1 crotonase/enoyl-CoA hydratase family protein [Mangrovivirga halotolerans]
MTHQYFKVEIKDKIANVAFNRPEKSNALHMEAWLEMKDIFNSISSNENARAIILSGEGNNFCAGIDLELLMSVSQLREIECSGRRSEKIRSMVLTLQETVTAIENCSKPVLAAVHKGCIGGGVDIISACDMRYCSDDAYFTIKEIDLGMVADVGTLQRLPKLISPGMVAEMAYTGRKVTGKEAQNIGLVNQCYSSKEEMMEYVKQIAHTIASKSPLSIRGTKEVLKYTRDHSVEDSLNYMATWNAAMLLSDDLTEAFKATIEKRQPKFKG